MQHFTVAYIDTDVRDRLGAIVGVRKEHKITRLRLRSRDWCAAQVDAIRRHSREIAYAGLRVDPADKAGAVERGLRSRAAEHIRHTDVFLCFGHKLLEGFTSISRAAGILLNQHNIEHIAVIVPPAAILRSGNSVLVGNTHAAGVLFSKTLRKLKGVFLTVFRYIIKKTAAVVVRLYNAVTVYTELLCSFNQFGIVFAALIDRCFLVLDCTGRQSGTLRGLHNISQHAAALST